MVKKEFALSINLLGAMSVSAGGVALPLPTSRKTRALLGYLILTAIPQRRSHLCELLWEAPNDPRGALRWSLSKLRPIVNYGGAHRLQTDRERLVIVLDDVDVDVHRIKACDEQDSTPEAMSKAWKATTETLLEDCELADLPSFSAWLESERQSVVSMRAFFAKRLALCDALAPEDTIVWADRWLEDQPFDTEAARVAVASRRRVGRMEDATQCVAELERKFRKAGRKIPSFPIDVPNEAPQRQLKRYVPGKVTQGPRQVVRFAKTEDDVCLAWASDGVDAAPPLVKAANWLTHLELDWEAPVWSPVYRELATGYRIIRYDERGCGLSDWDVPNIDFNSFVIDLRTVVDSAGLDRFALLGIGHGAAVSIEYAARHPDRVSHLILCGASPAGWRHTGTPAAIREREAEMVLAEAGWGRANASCRYLFSAALMPDATPEELAWFDSFQRRATSPRNAMRLLQAFSEIDVRHRLAEIKIPTLVIHSRDDQHVPLSTGRELAAAIPGAQFIALESKNHLLIGREPASKAFIAAVRQFLAGTR